MNDRVELQLNGKYAQLNLGKELEQDKKLDENRCRDPNKVTTS